jgi:hypothetical protein
MTMLYHVDQLLGNDRETNNEKHLLLGNGFLISKYTQLLLSYTFTNKHVPMATNPHATIAELLETAFSTQSMPRGYQ